MKNFLAAMEDFKVPKFLQPVVTREAWVGSAAEFIATFLFVYLGCGAVISSGTLTADHKLDSARLLVIATAHGLAIAALASATGGISGGHINPAVTFAMMVVRLMPVMKGVMYILAQILGAIAAAGLLSRIPKSLHNGLGTHSVSPIITELDAVIFEFFLTFSLVFVIFGTAVDPRGTGNTAPIAIGFTVFVDHLVGVPFTGASMNPARTLGPAVWEVEWDGFRVYLFGPLLGSACAAFAYTHFFQFPAKMGQEEQMPIKIHSMENPMFEHSRKFDKSISGVSRHESPNIFMV